MTKDETTRAYVAFKEFHDHHQPSGVYILLNFLLNLNIYTTSWKTTT